MPAHIPNVLSVGMPGPCLTHHASCCKGEQVSLGTAETLVSSKGDGTRLTCHPLKMSPWNACHVDVNVACIRWQGRRCDFHVRICAMPAGPEMASSLISLTKALKLAGKRLPKILPNFKLGIGIACVGSSLMNAK